MVSSRPFAASCVLNGKHTTISFYPETFTVRVCDVKGRRLREFFWYQTWSELLDALRSVTLGDARDSLTLA